MVMQKDLRRRPMRRDMVPGAVGEVSYLLNRLIDPKAFDPQGREPSPGSMLNRNTLDARMATPESQRVGQSQVGWPLNTVVGAPPVNNAMPLPAQPAPQPVVQQPQVPTFAPQGVTSTTTAVIPPALARLPMATAPAPTTPFQYPTVPSLARPVNVSQTPAIPTPSGIPATAPQAVPGIVAQAAQNVGDMRQAQNQQVQQVQDNSGLAADRAAMAQAYSNPAMMLPNPAPEAAQIRQRMNIVRQGSLPSGVVMPASNPAVPAQQMRDMGLNYSYTSAVPSERVGRLARGVDSTFGNSGYQLPVTPADPTAVANAQKLLDEQGRSQYAALETVKTLDANGNVVDVQRNNPVESLRRYNAGTANNDVVAGSNYGMKLGDVRSQNASAVRNGDGPAYARRQGESSGEYADRQRNIRDFNQNRGRGESFGQYNQRQNRMNNTPQRVAERQAQAQRDFTASESQKDRASRENVARTEAEGRTSAAGARVPPENSDAAYLDGLMRAYSSMAGSEAPDQATLDQLWGEIQATRGRMTQGRQPSQPGPQVSGYEWGPDGNMQGIGVNAVNAANPPQPGTNGTVAVNPNDFQGGTTPSANIRRDPATGKLYEKLPDGTVVELQARS